MVATEAPVLTNDIERMVCSFSWPCIEALNVMWCESGGRPDAWNDWENTADPYDGVAGLFQMAVPLHSALIGGDPFDPYLNARAAHELWTQSGWRHWAWVCRP